VDTSILVVSQHQIALTSAISHPSGRFAAAAKEDDMVAACLTIIHMIACHFHQEVVSESQ
jgi:hypothetical protein